MDQGGQLQIRWNPSAAAVRAAGGASLEIADGDLPLNVVPLDVAHLASGVFTYSRRNGRVDVTLVLDQPGGNKLRQVTSFLGQEPPAPVTPANSAQPELVQAKKDREEMSRAMAGLRTQLNAELESNRKLEKQLASARATPSPAQPELVQAKKDREEMSRAAAGLRTQLNAELESNRKLEKQLASARATPNPAPPNAAQQSKDREETSRLVAGLRTQLNAELESSRKLEKQLAAARAQLREQQMRRLNNQAPPADH